MKQEQINQILATNLESAKNGLTKVHKKTHSFQAVYILYFEEKGLYYIGSTRNLWIRITHHLWVLKRGEHHNAFMQSVYDESKNKNIRLSFIKVSDRKEGYEVEQLLLDKHFDSGLLINRFTNAEVNGHGVNWSQEAKAKQSEIAKQNALSGKIQNAWESSRKKVSIDGVVYNSLKEASELLNIPYNTLASRFANLKAPGSKYKTRYKYL